AAADARAAAEHVDEIGVAVGADQHAGRAFERDFLAGLGGGIGGGGQALLEIGLELLDAAVTLQDGPLALGDDRAPLLDRDAGFFELAGLVAHVGLEVSDALLGHLQVFV